MDISFTIGEDGILSLEPEPWKQVLTATLQQLKTEAFTQCLETTVTTSPVMSFELWSHTRAKSYPQFKYWYVC